MFLVNYFAVVSKKRTKVLQKMHIRKLNEQYLQKNDRFHLSYRPIAIHRKLACIWMAIGYDKC